METFKLTVKYTLIGLMGLLVIYGICWLWLIIIDVLHMKGIDLFIFLITLFSITILAISIEMNRKPKAKNYNRNTEDLISPVLAETIIDGKTDLKNLIMTTIIQLSLKGNIEIIDNKTIKLIDRFNNLEGYERELLNLIFQSGKRTIEFSDINSIFSKSKDGAYIFAENLSRAKLKILEYLCNIKIMSKKCISLIAYLKTISVLIMIDMPIITSQVLYETYDIDLRYIVAFLSYNILIITISLMAFLSQTPFRHEIISMKKNESKSNGKKYPIILYFILVILVVIISVVQLYNEDKIEHTMYFRKIVVIDILNILIIFVNRINALTDFGRKERLKLLELKNYINEYSLIKDRDLKSVVVWDEYLAYATAFGIPSKITSQIYESWYNMNITIQFIGSLF